MRVIVTRTGGVAGLRLSWQVVIDDLPDASDWFVLLRELPWDDVPDTPPAPDRFVYLIRFEPPTDSSPPEPEREAIIPEKQLTGPWKTLVEKVREEGDQRRPAPPRPSGTNSGSGGSGV